MTSTDTNSDEVQQPLYEDLDAPLPAVENENQSEVKVKPVPRPRSKLPPKSQCDNDNINGTVETADTSKDTTNTVSSQQSVYSHYKTPRPARPPPPALSKYGTSRQLTAAVEGDNPYRTSNPEPSPPAVGPEKSRSSTLKPKRPPPPSIKYNTQCSAMTLKSESYYGGGQLFRQSYRSSVQESPVSPADSTEEFTPFGTYNSTVTASTDTPAVPPPPPRLEPEQPSFSVSVYESSPPQRLPPPPSFTPPPPPEEGTPPESIYSEIEHPPYLAVLPEEDVDTMTLGRPTLRYQSDWPTTKRQTIDDPESIPGMVRWLKKVSKSDYLTLSVYGLSIEEEIRSFNERAMNVKTALRLYNLLMIKRKETLQNIIVEFSSISDCLDKIKKKAKNMGIVGGTTGAVGGVTAILGIALAPVTFGTSLVATAIGAGMVASAGGLGAHTAKANKKIVCRMKVEKLVYDYKSDVADLDQCLGFILSGMNELRRHDIARLQRAGAQPDALKVAHLSQTVFNTTTDRRTIAAHTCGTSEKLLLAFVKELDQYFTDDNDQKLKKSRKSKFSERVRLLAVNLQDDLDYMNHMWEVFG